MKKQTYKKILLGGVYIGLPIALFLTYFVTSRLYPTGTPHGELLVKWVGISEWQIASGYMPSIAGNPPLGQEHQDVTTDERRWVKIGPVVLTNQYELE